MPSTQRQWHRSTLAVLAVLAIVAMVLPRVLLLNAAPSSSNKKVKTLISMNRTPIYREPILMVVVKFGKSR